jgi:hypothetical protein
MGKWQLRIGFSAFEVFINMYFKLRARARKMLGFSFEALYFH